MKVALEWVLGDQTKVAEAWSAAIMKALVNLEGLRATYERTREAGQN